MLSFLLCHYYCVFFFFSLGPLYSRGLYVIRNIWFGRTEQSKWSSIHLTASVCALRTHLNRIETRRWKRNDAWRFNRNNIGSSKGKKQHSIELGQTNAKEAMEMKKARTNNNSQKTKKKTKLYIIKVYRSHLKTTPFSTWTYYYATIRTPWILLMALRTQFFSCGGQFAPFCLPFAVFLWCRDYITSIVECNSAGVAGTARIWNLFIEIGEYWFRLIEENEAEATNSNKTNPAAWSWRWETNISIEFWLTILGKSFSQIGTIHILAQNKRLYSMNLLWND